MSIIVGQTPVAAGYSGPATSVALPAGTVAGDLLVLGLVGGFIDPISHAECSDGRMVPVSTDAFSGRPAGWWLGYADDTGAPVAITLQGNVTATGQFAAGLLTVYRGPKWQPSRIAASSVGGEGGGSGAIPAVPGNGQGALALYTQAAGFGGLAVPSWSAPWAETARFPDAYVEVGTAWADALDPVPSSARPITDPARNWRVIVVGYDAGTGDTDTAVRQWPRDDGLGLSAGPRVYPIPKAQHRIVGGIP